MPSFGDVVLGRARPADPDLDAIFGLVPAAAALEAMTGFVPSGLGSVCFRTVDGGVFDAFAQVQRELRRLVATEPGATAEYSTDAYGCGWVLTRHPQGALERVVNDLHAVNATFDEGGFGPYLLCSLTGFARPDGRRLALVYTHVSGTFYPFAPAAGGGRDDALEDQATEAVGADLPFERDRARWFPLWDAPAI
ncbi:PspA-associated protein PspAB [Actinomadura rudentiformis]|uniref:Uncharacterized protein n=1 Tax=Actinomadura rudentiformis TaxID=359158 RepID=A0A6H9YLN6_9ACTN|nr:hypothetical protein [Actinomadura rudentiformis]KAB2342917.1 hypothetical protein F8566_35675 [Actinomadura rudentiformis]